MRIWNKTVNLMLAVVILSGTVYSQTGQTSRSIRNTDTITSDRRASKYILSPGTDALLIRIKIWGEVRNPGIYDVPSGIDLIELLSSAGGPSGSARLSSVKVIHRDFDADGNKILEVDIKEFLKTGDIEHIPVMRPDDIVVVPAKISSYIQTSFSWASTIAGLVATYALIIERLERAQDLKNN